jgi:ubiquitin C-terminal hydrolase
MGKGSGSGSGAIIVRSGQVAPVTTTHSDRHSERYHFSSSPISTAGPMGLQNVGNSCYANSVLHCLLSTALTNALLDPTAATIFRRFSSNPNILLQGSGSVDSDEDDESLSVSARKTKHTTRVERRRKREDRKMQENCQWLTGELRRLAREYHSPDSPESSNSMASWFSPRTRVVDPGAITKHPDRLSKCLRPFQQEDAHEFMRALLSTLVMNGHNKQLSSLFDGLLESSVTCTTCGRPSLTRDRYMDLSLDISGSHIETLTDALNEFTKTETLTGENKVHCQKCGTKRTATKGLRLATAPSILVCHLKRFAYDERGAQVRLRKKVRFPERLEIGDFMSRVNKARPPPYDLVAVLVHQGQSCDSGHYISYVKNNGEWFLCNDSVVRKVDIATVLDQQAYILMYEVAEMREKSGFPSPVSRPLRGRSSSWRDDSSSTPSARGFNFTSVMCGMDENFLTDICCTQSRFGKESKGPSNYESRLGHQTDDLSSHCESTPESFEPLNRCSSSGKVLDKRYGSKPLGYQKPDLNVIATSGLVSTDSRKPHVYALVPTGTKQVGLQRGNSSGQMFDEAKFNASAEATSVGLLYGRSDPGVDNNVGGDDSEDDLLNTVSATKWKPSKRISRPVCGDSSTRLPRHESYRRSPSPRLESYRRSSSAANARQELDDLSPS